MTGAFLKALAALALAALSLTGNAATPVLIKKDPIPYSAKEFECLAKNIFFEAGVERGSGKWAVAQVTWNRAVKTGKSICEVVYAKAQFSWTLFSKTRNAKPSGPNWVTSKRIAAYFLSGWRFTPVGKAVNYHAVYVKPYWMNSHRFVTVAKIGQHIFYRQA
jgi:spore germination cell wall hydrolase CwlJ-like protein